MHVWPFYSQLHKSLLNHFFCYNVTISIKLLIKTKIGTKTFLAAFEVGSHKIMPINLLLTSQCWFFAVMKQKFLKFIRNDVESLFWSHLFIPINYLEINNSIARIPRCACSFNSSSIFRIYKYSHRKLISASLFFLEKSIFTYSWKFMIFFCFRIYNPKIRSMRPL